MSPFAWNEKTSTAAVGLSEGKTQQEVADDIGVAKRTIQRWAGDMEFAAVEHRQNAKVNVRLVSGLFPVSSARQFPQLALCARDGSELPRDERK